MPNQKDYKQNWTHYNQVKKKLDPLKTNLEFGNKGYWGSLWSVIIPREMISDP